MLFRPAREKRVKRGRSKSRSFNLEQSVEVVVAPHTVELRTLAGAPLAATAVDVVCCALGAHAALVSPQQPSRIASLLPPAGRTLARKYEASVRGERGAIRRPSSRDKSLLPAGEGFVEIGRFMGSKVSRAVFGL